MNLTLNNSFRLSFFYFDSTSLKTINSIQNYQMINIFFFNFAPMQKSNKMYISSQFISCFGSSTPLTTQTDKPRLLFILTPQKIQIKQRPLVYGLRWFRHPDVSALVFSGGFGIYLGVFGIYLGVFGIYLGVFGTWSEVSALDQKCRNIRVPKPL